MFSDLILDLRLSNNWTQSELAERSGVKQPLIAGYEHGKKPSKKTLAKLAKGFGIPLEDFLKYPLKKSKNANVEEVDIAHVFREAKTLPLKYQVIVKEEIMRLLRLHQLEQDHKRLENMILKSKSPEASAA